jgi:1-aminocyclopropane-1-carboxylate deaminase
MSDFLSKPLKGLDQADAHGLESFPLSPFQSSPSQSSYQASTLLEPVHFSAAIGTWSLPRLQAIKALCLRLDLIHPHINGNKSFKLAGYAWHLDAGKPWLSFGGAYSNHLHALAYYGKLKGIETHGIVRGEDPRTQGRCLSATLTDCERLGMRLHFISRLLYRPLSQAGRKALAPEQLSESKPSWMDDLAAVVPLPATCEWIPEGGCGLPGVLGCQAIFNGLDLDQFEACYLSAATGAMLAGALTGPEWQGSHQAKMYAVPVLVANDWLRSDVLQWLASVLGAGAKLDLARVQFLEQAHWGGYAKAPAELIRFCQQWTASTGIPVEPTYSGKLFYAALSQALAAPLSALSFSCSCSLRPRKGGIRAFTVHRPPLSCLLALFWL